MGLFRRAHHEEGMTVILVTCMTLVVALCRSGCCACADGRIVEDRLVAQRHPYEYREYLKTAGGLRLSMMRSVLSTARHHHRRASVIVMSAIGNGASKRIENP